MDTGISIVLTEKLTFADINSSVSLNLNSKRFVAIKISQNAAILQHAQLKVQIFRKFDRSYKTAIKMLFFFTAYR